MGRRFHKTILFWAAVLSCSVAHAQSGATVEIHVLTARGEKPLAISVSLWPGNRIQAADPSGRAVFEGLPPGEYRIGVEVPDAPTVDTTFFLQAGDRRIVQIEVPQLAATLGEFVIEADSLARGTTLFNRREIAASGAHDLPGFLSSAASLDIRSDGTPGSVQTVRIGGSNANQVLVLVDGRRLQNVGSSEADLAAIPLEWIESVEITRGGRSDLGAEAIGGVVNIRTRIPSARTELAGTVEARSTWQRTTFVRSGTDGPIGSLLSFTRTQGPGDFRYTIIEDDGEGPFTLDLGKSYRRQNADVTRDQLIAKVTSNRSARANVELSGTLDRAVRGMPGYLAPQPTPLARQKSQEGTLNLRLSYRVRGVIVQTRATYQQEWREYDDPDLYAPVHHSEETGRQWESELRADGSWRRLLLSGGLNVGRETLESEQINNGRAGRDRYAMWMRARREVMAVPRWRASAHLEPGLRTEGFGADREILPQVSVGVDRGGSPTVSLLASWGKSYRAPTFYSLFWVDDQVARGNPELRPEHSTEWTGRFVVEQGCTFRSRLEITASDQRVNDLIQWTRTFDNRWKPLNLAMARIRTLDIAFQQVLWAERVIAHLAVNWTEARDATGDRNTGGKYLTFRAPRTERAGLSMHYGRWLASTNFRWVAARPVLETNSKWLSAYGLLDAGLGCTLLVGRLQIESTVGADNLTDENYRIIRHAPMPRREFYLNLRLSQEVKPENRS